MSDILDWRRMSRKIFAPALALALAACASGPAIDPAMPESVHVVLVTELGDIRLEIYQNRAPASAGSFLEYLDSGYYQNAVFYRTVRPDNDNGLPIISVLQGGVLDTQKTLPPVKHESTQDTGIRHADGVISLARSSPGTASGGAFFICIGDQPALDFGGTRNPDGLGFAAFGRVVGGMDLVREIHLREAEGHSASSYAEGQMLSHPVKVIAAYRE